MQPEGGGNCFTYASLWREEMKILSFISLLFFVLVSCSPVRNGDSTRPTVAVSIAPQQYLLERIVGDSMNIITLLPPDADPENYEPTIKTLRELSGCAVYFAVGNMPFEQVMLRRSGVENNGKTEIISAIGLQDITNTHCHDSEHHHHNDAADPHVWTSVRNCAVMARQMMEAVVKIDSANAEYYHNRYELLKQELDSLQGVFASRLGSCAGDMIIVEHPSLSYFARDYGINQLYFGAENKEVTPNRLRSVIDSARTHRQAVTMVSEANYNADRTRSIANQSNAECAEINTLSLDFLQQLDKLSIVLAKSHNAYSQSAK